MFPHELKRFERIVETFKKSLGYVDNISQITLRATLNTNPHLIDWNSELPTKTHEQFTSLCKEVGVATEYEIRDESDYLGVNEHRRDTIKISNPTDTIIFLDADLYFDERILAHQINAINLTKEIHEYYIITPQIIKLWDNTWDCIVNPAYINKSFQYYKTANPTTVVHTNYGGVGLVRNKTFKWGGGWFNAISANLLKYTGIPDSFVGYGPDDTFVMECCKLMKKHNMDIQQYILSNMVVMEDRTPIESSTKLRKSIPNFREECNKHFLSEVATFARKL